jgi:putative MATE family efflux protein
MVVRQLADDLAFGTDDSLFVGSGLEYAQSRAYEPGDPIKQLDWRVSAKLGKPFVKEYDSLRRIALYLVVDTSSSMSVSSGPHSKHDLAVWLAAALGVGTTVVLGAGAPAFIAVMGATGEVAAAAEVYLRIRALASVPVLLVMVGHGAFRGRKDMRTPLLIALAVNLGNAVVSWALIYPGGLGIAGAAWGTVIAQSAGATTFLVLGRRRFAPPDLRIEPVAMRRIAGISRDLFLRTAALLSGLLVSTAVAARMGTVTVAAHQIARELWTMLALVQDGFAIAGQAMIGTALGAGLVAEARVTALRLVGWGTGFGFVVGGVYLALANVLPGVFTTDPTVLLAVGAVWGMVALLQPVGGVVFVLDGILMGAGDFRFLWWSTALASLAGLVPVCLAALRFGWGLAGIWAGMIVMMVTRAVLSVWRLRSGRWALSVDR